MKPREEEPQNKPNCLEDLLGERVTLFCVNYIYTGALVDPYGEYIQLTDAGIVYETGELGSKTWKDMQKLPNDVFVMKSAVESFMLLK
jgi:hypothetical protein